MADIFISYKREELARAAQVAQALSEEGFSAFYDLHEDGIHAGEQWDKRLEAELEAARCCVVLWSVASVASDNVRSEARRAHQRSILVPAKIGACTPPIGLDSLQEVDLRAWRGDRSDSQWRYLVDRGVARKLGRPGRPPAAAKPEAARPSPPPPPRYAPSPSVQTPHVRLPRWAFGAGAAALALVSVLIWQPWRLGGVSLNDASPIEQRVDNPADAVSEAAAPATVESATPPVEAPSIPLPEMVRIPGRNFEAGRYEVTFAQWDACVVAGGCTGYMPSDEGWGRGGRPVINVSWNDAQAYVQWLSQRTGQRYRLLNGAEWEYAARADSTTPYSWGVEIPVCDQGARNGANFNACTDNRPQPVGSFQPNAFGLYDVHGNVSEWVEDCNNDGPVCSSRVVRGGSWKQNAFGLRSGLPGALWSTDRYSHLGFRVARTF